MFDICIENKFYFIHYKKRVTLTAFFMRFGLNFITNLKYDHDSERINEIT
jgi:hypothetical protein